MKIPKKVKIGAQTFNIKLVDQIDPTKAEADDWLGETTHSTLTIKIRKGKRESIERTFCHELFHAFNSALGDEKIVEALGSNLHSLIKDNPKIFK